MENDPKKEELDFVHDDDLLPVLEQLGIKNEFLAGSLTCAICGESVTQENLSALTYDDAPKLVCDKQQCVAALDYPSSGE